MTDCTSIRLPAIHDSAFTLVESLVATGIIATLIAILFPALSKARQSAVPAQCQSNMEQTYYAIIMYTNEYGGYFPPDTQIEVQKSSGGQRRRWMGRSRGKHPIRRELGDDCTQLSARFSNRT